MSKSTDVEDVLSSINNCTITETSRRSEDFDSNSLLAEKLTKARDSISDDMLQNLNYNYEDHSLDYLLTTTEALIAVNDDIFERINPFFIPRSSIRLHFERTYCRYVYISNFQLNNFDEMHRTRSTNENRVRNGYRNDIAEVPEPKLSLLPLSQRKITAPLITESKDFPSPPNIPDKISKILAINKHKDHPWFVDYNNLLQNMLIINEKVLKSTIVLLRDHLEEIQVYLGNIEKWVTEKSVNRDFVSGLFGPDMVMFESITKEDGLKFDLDQKKEKEKLTQLKKLLDLYENDDCISFDSDSDSTSA